MLLSIQQHSARNAKQNCSAHEFCVGSHFHWIQQFFGANNDPDGTLSRAGANLDDLTVTRAPRKMSNTTCYNFQLPCVGVPVSECLSGMDLDPYYQSLVTTRVASTVISLICKTV